MNDRPMNDTGRSGLRLRRGNAGDAEGMLAVKRELMMPLAEGSTAQGGFLLGSSAEQYALFLAHASVWILEEREAGRIAGFAIGIPDPLLRASDLWERREAIVWEGGDWERIAAEPVGYFEQLAVLPDRRYRIYGPALGLAALNDLIDRGHRHLFATIVREPLHNLAAVPLLEGIGARRVGDLEEVYEGVGRIRSDLYYLDRSHPGAPDPIATTELGRKIMGMMREVMEKE